MMYLFHFYYYPDCSSLYYYETYHYGKKKNP